MPTSLGASMGPWRGGHGNPRRRSSECTARMRLQWGRGGGATETAPSQVAALKELRADLASVILIRTKSARYSHIRPLHKSHATPP